MCNPTIPSSYFSHTKYCVIVIEILCYSIITLQHYRTFMMGYGTPTDEDFSLLVIFVISIGLGLPALLIVISGIVMAVRRISQKKDDLFLNR